MSDIRRGWIIDVDLEPTRGSETGKVRPCVVVTNDVYNERVPVIQVVPLTEWTAKKGKIKTNVRVEPSVLNGLSKLSLAEPTGGNRGLFANSTDRSAAEVGGG
jgi:mRNA interferase MazF